VAASLRAGADIVSFSGDKLLGGPQAGIIVGRRELIERLKANPLARALRLDKMTIAALEATLRLYLHPEEALRKVPTLRMLTESAEDVRARAESLLDSVAKLLPEGSANLTIVPEISRAGGGSLPMCDIPTYALEVRFLRGNAQDCGRHLVQDCPVPIVARISHEVVLCDARTLTGDDEMRLVAGGIASYFETVQ
jgi:L-seryl-tRNA(Ser) seleniumtransferase